MKKAVPVVIVVVILLIIGKVIMTGKVNDLEEDIVRRVIQGNYYAALEDANEIEQQGGKLSRKNAKLIEDVKLLQAAQEEVGKCSEMNLGRVKAILDEMNGSYKKYEIFKADVQTLKENVDALEQYGNAGVELIEKVEALIDVGKMEEAKELLLEYKDDEKYEYMPESLQSSISGYLNQVNGISW